MMELFYGLPGDGKSYSATKMVVEMLIKSSCYVCHNIPLVEDGLIAEYCEAHSRWGVDVKGRLRKLTDSEMAHFWRHLGPGWDIPGGTGEGDVQLPDSKIVDLGNGRKLTVPNYDCVPDTFPGTCYILDEAHIHFSAYRWAEISEECTWAISQHRHLGIEIVLVSQHPEKIAKAVRRDIHRFTRVKNFGNRRTLGFVAKGRFRRVTYPEMPTKGSETMVEEASWFKFDLALANLYKTNEGVGITGKVFKVERRPKGLPLKALFVIVPLALVLIWSVPYYGCKLISSGVLCFVGAGSARVRTAVAGMVARPVSEPTNAVPVAVGVPLAVNVEHSGVIGAAKVSVKSEDSLELVAYAFAALAPAACSWTFSDGTVVGQQSEGFVAGGRGWCVYRGKRYDYRAKSERRELDRGFGQSFGRGNTSFGNDRELRVY